MPNLEQSEQAAFADSHMSAVQVQFSQDDFAIIKKIVEDSSGLSKPDGPKLAFPAQIDFSDFFRTNRTAGPSIKDRFNSIEGGRSNQANQAAISLENESNDSIKSKIEIQESILPTGDLVCKDGSTTTLTMPSGEQLVINGTEWSLKDGNGKELANKNTGNSGKLADGAYMDKIVPFVGPGWHTINYPNGDQISIREGTVSIDRGKSRAEVFASLRQESRLQDRPEQTYHYRNQLA